MSIENALANSGRLIKEGGAEAVKLEGGVTMASHWLDRRRQYFIGRDLADAFAAHSQAGGPIKTHFGINVDDYHICLNRLLEVFVAAS